MRAAIPYSQEVAGASRSTSSRSNGQQHGTTIAVSPSIARLGQLIDMIETSPRMVAQRAKVDQFVPPGYPGVVQRRPLNPEESDELSQLGDTFARLRDEYRASMAFIERILGLAQPLPLNLRYLGNRLDSSLRPLNSFLDESADIASGDRSKTLKLLQRLRSRHKWYTEGRSGQALVKLTLEDVKSQEASFQHVATMEGRRRIYGEDRIAGLSARELRRNPGSISDVQDAQTDAIKLDPEQSTGGLGWRQVDDNPPKNPNSPPETSNKFINMFHPSAMIMLENYRDKTKGYFASDALFDQWMRATNSATLLNLPESFPKYFYRNHIENPAAREQAERLLGDKTAIWVALGSEDWNALKVTDNVKSTMNILNEYNKINQARRLRIFRCEGVLIYKGPSMKFTMSPGR